MRGSLERKYMQVACENWQEASFQTKAKLKKDTLSKLSATPFPSNPLPKRYRHHEPQIHAIFAVFFLPFFLCLETRVGILAHN
jgi:hypothetical protein